MTSATALAPVLTAIRRRTPRYRRVMSARVEIALKALAVPRVPDDLAGRLTVLADLLATPTHRVVWLVLAVLKAELPVEEDVIEAGRVIALDGGVALLQEVLVPRGAGRLASRRLGRAVEVVRSGVLVDISHTSTVEFATGIQRVVRETVKRWNSSQKIVPVAWTRDRKALRRLDAREVEVALNGASDLSARKARIRDRSVIVPLDGNYVLAELNIDARSLGRIAALARFDAARAGVIGYDQVPITSGETTDGAMPAAFAVNLTAVRWMDDVVAISDAAAEEYAGWREMQQAIGLDGPRISAVPLPIAAPGSGTDARDRAEAGELLAFADLPMFLCVGSHEPRKNHLAVLHAAELLWREGREFSLAFVGGNAWNSEAFVQQCEELVAHGRPIRTVTALSDRVLWAGYAISRAVLFPSLNEGFGLPVAEALAVGVPVLTSDFGSTRQIATNGGAVFVDPRDDESIVDGMRSLLVDHELYERLLGEARATPLDTWDAYAAAVWSALVKVER